MAVDPAGWPAADGAATGIAPWNRLWDALAGRRPDESVHAGLLRHYAERHRAYHTRQHLDECLTLLDGLRADCEREHEVAAALWFHDAFYLPRRGDNELRSADWLAEVASAAGLPADVLARLHALVMATRHDAVPVGRDAQVLVDIDLAILGSPQARFDAYERQVRVEYRWVPKPLYRRKRAAVLASFLARPRLYSTDGFFERFERPARENLGRSIALLGS